MKNETTKCPRCDGKGSYFHFGTCFRCLGTGVVATPAEKARLARAAKEIAAACIRDEHAGLNVFEGNCVL